MTITFTSLGGSEGVTGSRHLLENGSARVLIDCGLFQGPRHLREMNWSPFPVRPRDIEAVALTHAHLDHSGLLPKLIREGYDGRVYCSSATADLCKILLTDSAFLQEREADLANRYGYSKHKPALPLYSESDAIAAIGRLESIPFRSKTDFPGGASITLRRAGHILGAASIEVNWERMTIVFSGDIGRFGDDVMVDPEMVRRADYLVVESTYGDRSHEKIDPAEALGRAIERTVARGGTVVIPAFAVGRAQSILYHIWKLKSGGRLRSTPIFLDSPMAIDATELLCAHMDDHRMPERVCVESCKIAEYVRDAGQSKMLSASSVPKVIISASGMATGGRVLHHIKAFGGDAKNTILFAGYQAAGTRGAALINGATEIKFHGEMAPVRAEIANLSMLSAHADASEIIRWLEGFERPPRRTFVVHGEPSASEALRARIIRDLGWDCQVVRLRQPYVLE